LPSRINAPPIAQNHRCCRVRKRCTCSTSSHNCLPLRTRSTVPLRSHRTRHTRRARPINLINLLTSSPMPARLSPSTAPSSTRLIPSSTLQLAFTLACTGVTVGKVPMPVVVLAKSSGVIGLVTPRHVSRQLIYRLIVNRLNPHHSSPRPHCSSEDLLVSIGVHNRRLRREGNKNHKMYCRLRFLRWDLVA
jgi:hypothetical protein